jgi:drug/metabolite transporter (DMT)-like permease
MMPPAQRTGRSATVLEGYALVAASFLIWGSIGAFVRYSTMPESALIVFRMVVGTLLVGGLFARRATLAEVRRADVWPNILVMGALSSGILLLFFLALRLTDVAIGMFLLFTGPVYVAFLAPRLMHQRPDRIVYPALAIALAGMATILLPGLFGAERISTTGVLCGVTSGVLLAGITLVTKRLTRKVRSTTVALGEMVVDTVILLPLAAWQVFGTGYRLTRNDLVAGLALGILCTAIPYVLYAEGLRRIRVEHASILGYLEPVSAPFYALLLLGEAPSASTVAGGALIVVAGVVVVLFGAPEAAPELGP